jgi:hypothetical protein
MKRKKIGPMRWGMKRTTTITVGYLGKANEKSWGLPLRLLAYSSCYSLLPYLLGLLRTGCTDGPTFLNYFVKPLPQLTKDLHLLASFADRVLGSSSEFVHERILHNGAEETPASGRSRGFLRFSSGHGRRFLSSHRLFSSKCQEA